MSRRKNPPPPPRGRPPLPEELRQSDIIRARVTQSEREKYETLGGKRWLVTALKRARV